MAGRKIIILPTEADSGRGPVTIADDAIARGPGSKLVQSWGPELDAMVQTAPGFRAKAMKNVRRGDDTYNKSTRYNVVVAYEFASEDEVALFVRSLSELPAVSTVQFSVNDVTWYLVDAKIAPITTVLENGHTLVLSFSISGGVPQQQVDPT